MIIGTFKYIYPSPRPSILSTEISCSDFRIKPTCPMICAPNECPTKWINNLGLFSFNIRIKFDNILAATCVFDASLRVNDKIYLIIYDKILIILRLTGKKSAFDWRVVQILKLETQLTSERQKRFKKIIRPHGGPLAALFAVAKHIFFCLFVHIPSFCPTAILYFLCEFFKLKPRSFSTL